MTQNFKPSIDVNVLYRLRNSPFEDHQNELHEFHKLLVDNKIQYKESFDVDSKTHKRNTNDTVREICKLNKLSVRHLKDDPKKMLTYLLGMFSSVEFSAIAKIVIHFQLFGGTILEVGTDYHHQKYFNDIDNFNIVGGFAMTEMGHGSNVRQIETTATYDHATKEFVINSPSLSSTKFWIGNVSMFGTHVVLFTKLIFQGEDKGVHVIVVPLRDPKTMELYKNIQLGDCGHKIGWNGIDNAWIRFNNYRVPRENLLNRFATITEDGQYLTNISSPGKLFQITISQLVFGRLLYICGPTSFMDIGLKTAIRYAFSRRQFGEKGKPEELIIDYPTHNRVLLPMMATNMVFEFSRNWIIENLQESSRSDEKREEYHSIVSGVKAMVCEYAVSSLNKLRVFCGGNGVSSYNYFGAMRADLDVFQTAEGDGAVLYQQLSKFLLSEYKKWYKKQGMTGYIMKEVQTFLTTSNPIHTHYRSMPYLLSNEFHHHAFLFRFEKTRSIVIDHLNQCKGKGLSFLQSWNASLTHVVDLAKSYTHLFMLENAQRTIQKVTDPITRHVLNDIIRLYALSNIEQDFGFFRNWNYLSSGKALALSEAVSELCNTLKPYTLSILESHKFNNDTLNIPLAKKDLDYVKHMADRVGIPYSSL